MKELNLMLDDSVFEVLTTKAAEKGESVRGLVEDLINRTWGSVDSAEDEWSRIQRFLVARVKGAEFVDLARQLGESEQALRDWDERIRTNPSEWRKAFFYLRKKTDSIDWELKTMDAFYDHWGKLNR